MTRKQFNRNMMIVHRNITRYAKENGIPYNKNTDRMIRPTWGRLVITGKYRSQVLQSYEQAWDEMRSALKGTPFLYGTK